MYKNKILTFFIVILSFPIVLLAQNTDEINVIRNFERNYDSLLSSFYIKQNSKVIRTNYNKNTDNLCSPTSACNVPDSVFARRLRQLPSSFKLTYNRQVRNIIEYYIDKSGARVSVMLGLSKYYFPIFEEILDQYSVPHELKYLVVIESALNPNAVSPAGAAGLWQFMYATGRMYDLRINSVIDDRKDPIKASVAAARFLRDLYKIYNDWELALAAYNCGPGNVNKAIRRSGKTDFWGIYDFLPKETRGYVPSYIAACYVMNYYKEHNITPAILTKPIATDTVMVRRDIHFNQIAEVLNIPSEQIKDLNPQYKLNKIMGTQDKYSLKLPLNYIKSFISLEDSIAEYNKAKYFEPEWKQKEYTYKEVPITHKVRKKETWASIAKRYGVSVNDLKRWNGNKTYPPKGTLLTVYKTVKVEVDKTQESPQQNPFVEENVSSSGVTNAEENVEKVEKVEDIEDTPINIPSKPVKLTKNEKANKEILDKKVNQGKKLTKEEKKEKERLEKKEIQANKYSNQIAKASNKETTKKLANEKKDKNEISSLTKEERTEFNRLNKKIEQGRELTKKEKARKKLLDKKEKQSVNSKVVEKENNNLTKEERTEFNRLNKKVEQGRELTKKEKERKKLLDKKEKQIAKTKVVEHNEREDNGNLNKEERTEFNRLNKKIEQGKELTKKEKARKKLLDKKESQPIKAKIVENNDVDNQYRDKDNSNLTKAERKELDRLNKKVKLGKELTKNEKENKKKIEKKEKQGKSDSDNKVENKKNKKKSDNESQSASTYKVQKGESIYSIAKKHGMTTDELLKLNKLDSKKPIINPGQKIKVK